MSNRRRSLRIKEMHEKQSEMKAGNPTSIIPKASLRSSKKRKASFDSEFSKMQISASRKKLSAATSKNDESAISEQQDEGFASFLSGSSDIKDMENALPNDSGVFADQNGAADISASGNSNTSVSPYKDFHSDIIAQFHRRELFKLSFACRRFRNIITDLFSEKPYYFFNCTLYHNIRTGSSWTWKYGLLRIDQKISLPYLYKVTKPEFLRINNGDFRFESSTQAVSDLQAMSHTWQKRSICFRNFQSMPSLELARLLSTAANLDLYFPLTEALNSVLKEFFAGNCINMKLEGPITNTVEFKLPVNEIMDYLFRPSSEDVWDRKLVMKTVTNPTFQWRDELFGAAEKRFLDARDTHRFFIEWNFDAYPKASMPIRLIKNTHTDQHLVLTLPEGGAGFRITVYTDPKM
ncbi:hypothetical protein Ddc_09571 [Ditylenchus destructor]|nr:hypothetical protein Ddc_09571 [Ditylenchus destructor]